MKDLTIIVLTALLIVAMGLICQAIYIFVKTRKECRLPVTECKYSLCENHSEFFDKNCIIGLDEDKYFEEIEVPGCFVKMGDMK